MAQTAKAQKFYDVPAGTRSSQCNGSTCRAVIYWIPNPATGRMMPIDCDVDGGQPPAEHVRDPRQESLFGERVEHHDGRGVSHFTTCPDVGEFANRNKK